MSPLSLGFVWLVASMVVLMFVAFRLQPLREQAVKIADGELRSRTLTRLDAATAASFALFAAAFAYLIFGLFVPAVISWSPRLLEDVLIVLPFIALSAMLWTARIVPHRVTPSWRVYGRYLWYHSQLLVLLVVLPVLLTHIAAPIWVYPALLYASCFAMMFTAYRKANVGAKPTGASA